MMRSNRKKLQLLGAFAALFSLALAIGCTGFFQNPTLTSLTVGPVLNVDQGATGQLSVTGTYSDGSTKSLSTGLVWSTSDDTIATVNNSGLVTGVSAGGPVTITAADGTVTGTTSVTVVLVNVTAININPTTADATANGGFATFQAFATVSGDTTTVDVTSTATWTITSTTSGSTADFSITQGDPLTVTVESTATVGEVATITATYTSGSTTFTATAKLTVD
jgi:hypothetical protein